MGNRVRCMKNADWSAIKDRETVDGPPAGAIAKIMAMFLIKDIEPEGLYLKLEGWDTGPFYAAKFVRHRMGK